jgi:phosphate starvation-inducible PhoH-like protein
MVVHFQKYGKITTEQVKTYLSRDKNNEEEAPVIIKEDDDVLLYGTKGVVIRVKSPNQKKLIDAATENDIVFAIGPAGTGKLIQRLPLR